MASTKQKIEEGWIQARVVLEVVGKPKEHVEKTIKEIVRKVKKEKDLEILDEHIAEIKKQKSGAEGEGVIKELWATFAEMEILFKSLTTITYFSFEYMPSSIEIVEPQSITIPAINLSEFFNDLQLRLHQVDMVIKQLQNKNSFFNKNMLGLLKNFILILLSAKERTPEQLARLTGVNKDTIEDFLDRLIDEGKVEMEGDKYRRTDGGKK